MRTWKTNTSRGPSNIAPPEGPSDRTAADPASAAAGSAPSTKNPSRAPDAHKSPTARNRP